MDNLKKTALVAFIEKMKADKGFTQNKLAEHLGISTGHIGNILKSDEWHKVGDGTWNKLYATWMPKAKWKFYDTINARIIFKACAESQENSTANCVSDYTGGGKTLSLRRYSQETPESYYICGNQMMNDKELLREIQRAVGLTVEGTKWKMTQAIIEEIKKKAKPFFIFDEIDKLSEKAMMILKVLFDGLEGKCGFLIAGTEVFREKIERFSRKNKLGYREFSRRFCNYFALVKFDISDEKTGKKLKEELYGICRDQGIIDEKDIVNIINKADNYGTLYNLIQMRKQIT
jgi:DNA transposition AAA+ family ATPase